MKEVFMGKKGKPQQLTSLISRKDSISNDSQSSRKSTALTTMDEEGKEHISNLNARILKHTRARMNSDLVLRRSRSISSRDKSSDYLGKNIQNNFRRFGSDTDLLSESHLPTGLKYSVNKNTTKKNNSAQHCSCMTNKIFYQVAVVVSLDGLSEINLSNLLCFLDIATAAMFHSQTAKSDFVHQNVKEVDTFCTVISSSQKSSSLVQTSVKFDSPTVSLKKLKDDLCSKAKENINVEHGLQTTKITFQQLTATISHLCNSLPWSCDLAQDTKGVVKSIYVLIPESNQFGLNSRSSPLHKDVQNLKAHLLDQPAGGINLLFVSLPLNPSKCNDCTISKQIIDSSIYKPENIDEKNLFRDQSIVVSGRSLFSRWELKDLYTFTGRFLPSYEQGHTKIKNENLSANWDYFVHKLELDVIEPMIRNRTKIMVQDPTIISSCIDRKLTLHCTCVPLLPPYFFSSKLDTKNNFSSMSKPPPHLDLEFAFALPLSDIEQNTKFEALKSHFLISCSTKNKGSPNNSDYMQISAKASETDVFSELLTILRLNHLAILFTNNLNENSSKKGQVNSSFILIPLSPFMASLQEFSSLNDSKFKTKNLNAPFRMCSLSTEVSSSSLPHPLPFELKSTKDNSIQKVLFALSMICLEVNDEILEEGSVSTSALGDASSKIYDSKNYTKNVSNCRNQVIDEKIKEINAPSEFSNNESFRDVNHLPGEILVKASQNTFEPFEPMHRKSMQNLNNLLKDEKDTFDTCLRSYNQCVELNDPTPIKLVVEEIIYLSSNRWESFASESLKRQFKKEKISLNTSYDDEKRNMIASCCRKLCFSTDDVSYLCNKGDDKSKQRKIRIIQIQILLRMQILVLIGEYTLDVRTITKSSIEYNKSNKNKKKKNKSSKHDRNNSDCIKKGFSAGQFVEYIASLLSLVRFSLTRPSEFSQFFHENIVHPFLDSLPQVVRDIADYFDMKISREYVSKLKVKTKTNDSESNVKFTLQNSRPKDFSFLSTVEEDGMENRNQAEKISTKLPYESKRIETERRNIAASNSGNSYSPSWVKRTGSLKRKSTSKNPLLADGRGKYIGNHFNTKLSNMSTLFREVKLKRRVNSNHSTLGINRSAENSQRQIKKSASSSSFMESWYPASTKKYSKDSKSNVKSATLSPPTTSIKKSKVVRETPVRNPKKRKISSSMFDVSPQKEHLHAAILVAEATFASRKNKSKDMQFNDIGKQNADYEY